MARTVEDAALFLDVTATHQPPVAVSSVLPGVIRVGCGLR